MSTYTWNADFEANPTNDNYGYEIDDYIRKLALSVRERMEKDHYWAIAGTDADHGEHVKVTLRVGAAPTAAANKGFLYAKDVNAKAELHYIDEDSNEVQLTGGGSPGITGEIKMWPTDTAPAGYLLCYGQAVSRTTYAALFAVISTTFGVGDNSTTFNLPDFRGRVPLGQDDMGGSAANRVTAAAADSIGGSGGEENHLLTTAEMPSHTHTVYTIYSAAAYGQPSGAIPYGGYTNVTSSSAGSDGAHNNMQPYLTLNYIIKT